MPRRPLRLKPGQRLVISHKEPFTPSALERRKKIKETIAEYVFLAMTGVLVLPVVLILGFLVVKAWPALSFSFLFENPTNYMKAGGIWAPLIGTFFLVLLSLAIAAPIGVLAGVYLNEYARNNWFNRLISLAVVNLAGVPSIVHALFGVGAFVLFHAHGQFAFGGLLHHSGNDAAGDYHQHARSPGFGAHGVSRSLLEPGRHAMADHPHDCLAQFHQRHPYRRDSASFPGGGRNRADPFYRRGVFRARGRSRLGFVLSLWTARPTAWRCRMHLFTLTTQVQGVSSEIQYGTAVVLIGLVLLVNSRFHRTKSLSADAEEVVERFMPGHICFNNVTVTYGPKTALADVTLDMPEKQIFAIIGPANSGKTTLLKCINRTIDFIPSAKVRGQVLIDGVDVCRVKNVYELRRRVGMVFPLPVGLPLDGF